MEFVPSKKTYLHVKLCSKAKEEDVKGLGATYIYRDKLWDSLTLVFEPQDIDPTLRRVVEELPSEVEILEAGLCPDIMSSPSILRISSKITLSSGETMPLPGSNAVLIRSNLAFGTGHHPTTEFCIRLLEKAFSIRSPKVVMDLGTGSGVLALCAVKLGAKKVIALDVDPRACWEAKQNVRLNHMDGTIKVICGSIDSVVNQRKFDLLVANLTIGTIRALGINFPNLVHGSGLIIISGFSDTHTSQVLSIMGQCHVYDILCREGWAALLIEPLS